MDEDEKPGKKKKDAKQVAGQVVEPLLLTDGEPDSDEEIFKKAVEWYNATPEWEDRAGGKFANRTIVELRRALNLTYNQAAEVWDKIIDSIYIPADENVKPIKIKKSRKKKGDTMKVERTLDIVTEPPCCSDKSGCCSCETDNCDGRETKFGDAVSCRKPEACSHDCPRLIK